MSEEIVGPIFGPHSEIAAASAARFIRNGAQYDVAIGGLPFVTAISDERPYARETAEFRTQQIDTGQSVGDQSLTGYWTRGQASFHRGAGVTYYEVLEGDGIANRFTDSLGVNVWEPGEVTLRSTHPTIYGTGVLDAVLHDGAFLTLASGGGASLITYSGASSAEASSDGNPFAAICSDGVNAYGINDAYIEQLTPGGSFSVLWTHGDGNAWTHLFWAKDRLWAVDDEGDWYTLSTAGGTTSGTDVLWSSGKVDVHWSLTDSEGGVFIATGNQVFLSTVDSSTATPTLVTPVTVATVGAQETISRLGSYLGYLTVLSDAGARLGQIQSAGVVLGAINIEGDFSGCARFSYRDDLVQITGVPDNAVTLFELNALEQTSDLMGAWAPAISVSDTTSDPHGSLVLPDGRTMTFSADGISLDFATIGSSGYVQTGFHRFGTLELKDFRSLTVRAEGTKGSIGVELIKRDGAATPLLTLGVANFFENEIALNLPGPTDFIGFRFTLNSEDGVAPKLLGYQLRAWPAPQRHRLVQIPLLCFDQEKIGNVSYGKQGWAQERLAALEEMERSAGALLLQDFITGETGTVFIERVQFQSKTPSSPGDKSRGGYVVLTLRQVS